MVEKTLKLTLRNPEGEFLEAGSTINFTFDTGDPKPQTISEGGVLEILGAPETGKVTVTFDAGFERLTRNASLRKNGSEIKSPGDSSSTTVITFDCPLALPTSSMAMA